MKLLKYISYMSFLGLLVIMTGCKKEDGLNDNQEGNQDKDTRISTYEIQFTGGKYDGTTFTGSFPNDVFSGGGGYINKDISHSEKNEVTIGFSDVSEQKIEVGAKGRFLLNSNGKAIEIGVYLEDLKTHSGLAITMHEEGETALIYTSKNGTVTLTDLKVGPNVGGSVYSDYNVEFEGDFENTKFNPDTGEYETTEVHISGEIEIRSIREK